jgi:hypothetical protein
MTRATNKASGGDTSTSPFSRRRNHQNFEDDALIMLLIRGQSQSLAVTSTANRIQQRNSAGTNVPRSAAGLVEAREEIFYITNTTDSSDHTTSARTTSPQRRARHSLDSPSGDTRRREADLSALLSEACQLAEASQLLVDDGDESEDL